MPKSRKRQQSGLVPASVQRGSIVRTDSDDVFLFNRLITADLGEKSAREQIAVAPSARQQRNHSAIRGSESRSIRFGAREIYTGMVPLHQLGNKMMAAEGLIEFDFWQMVGFAWTDIVQAYAQPAPLEILVFGEPHRWTPDALIERRNGERILVECKPLEWAQPDQEAEPDKAAWSRECQRAMKATAERAGCTFCLMTEHEVRLEPRFHNAKVMRRALAALVPQVAVDAAVKSLRHAEADLVVRNLIELAPRCDDFVINLACVLDSKTVIRLDRREFFGIRTPFRNLCSSNLNISGTYESQEPGE